MIALYPIYIFIGKWEFHSFQREARASVSVHRQYDAADRCTCKSFAMIMKPLIVWRIEWNSVPHPIMSYPFEIFKLECYTNYIGFASKPMANGKRIPSYIRAPIRIKWNISHYCLHIRYQSFCTICDTSQYWKCCTEIWKFYILHSHIVHSITFHLLSNRMCQYRFTLIWLMRIWSHSVR